MAILILSVRLLVCFVKMQYENVLADSNFDQKLGQSSTFKTVL